MGRKAQTQKDSGLAATHNSRHPISILNRIMRYKLFHTGLIVMLGLLVYSNTYQVPFQWDEQVFIVDNPIVHNLDYFLSPAEAVKHEHYGAFIRRYVVYFTFALQYAAHGTEVFWYHIVNTLIHVGAGLLVYFFALGLCRTPFLAESETCSKYAAPLALLAALLFTVHPIQTEAVTYVYQRLASLTAFFYLGAVCSYLYSRLSHRKWQRVLLYICCILLALLAVKSKEHAFTLPFAVGLLELSFFRGRILPRLAQVLPLFLVALLIPLTVLGVASPAGGNIIADLHESTQVRSTGTHLEYLYTQFRAIPEYIRLLFAPVNQTLIHDIKLSQTFWQPKVWMGFLFISGILIGALLLFKNSKAGGNPREFRLAAFGILWFFLALSVESSLVALNMLMHEYRVYLPSVGAFIALATAGMILWRRLERDGRKAIAATGYAGVIVLLGLLTYQRNMVWQTRLGFWEDVVAKSPNDPRGYNTVGLMYYNKYGMRAKGIRYLERAVEVAPGFMAALNNLGNLYRKEGRYEEAIEVFERVIRLQPEPYEAHYNIGLAYEALGKVGKALDHFQQAVELRPDLIRGHKQLAENYVKTGATDTAIQHYEVVLDSDPADINSRTALARLLAEKKEYARARAHLTQVAQAVPKNAKAHFNLGVLCMKAGDYDKAEIYFKKTLELDPDYGAAKRALIKLRQRNSTITR